MAAHQLVTAEELERMGHQDFGYELVGGTLVPVNPPGGEHGRLATHIAAELLVFARARGLGTVYVETGYVLFRGPDTVGGPDVSFLSGKRPAAVRAGRGFVPATPDLASRSARPTTPSLRSKPKPGNTWTQARGWFGWLTRPRKRSTSTSRAARSECSGLVPSSTEVTCCRGLPFCLRNCSAR